MKLGYIKIEDFIELVRLADKVIMETEHYVSIHYTSSNVEIYVMKNGFNYKKEFDFARRFIMYDPWAPERDAEKFQETKEYLKGLLNNENV